MTREELEHIIRASAEVTGQYEFVIIGSQSMLGAVPYPERIFTVSMEVDIYPLQSPDLADKIDGSIGEGSLFHETHGYYAQGVGPNTAILPRDWMSRVHRVQNRQTKDREFCSALLKYGYLSPEDAIDKIPIMPIGEEDQKRLLSRIRRWAKP